MKITILITIFLISFLNATSQIEKRVKDLIMTDLGLEIFNDRYPFDIDTVVTVNNYSFYGIHTWVVI